MTPAAAEPARPAARTYRERLTPGPWLFIALLLLIPAVMLTVTPMSSTWALPVAIVVYLVVAGALTLMSPVITVQGGVLTAGPAHISVELLGDAEVLDRDSLSRAIGPGTDARSYLVIRGYIHSGLRIAVTDAGDPTPQWIMTTRRPEALLAAIRASRAEPESHAPRAEHS